MNLEPEFANNRNAKVITLTDSIHSPINLYSSCNLIARSDMASIVDSLVAPLSVINALVVALCMKKQDEVIATLETLEEIWDLHHRPDGAHCQACAQSDQDLYGTPRASQAG